MGTFICYWTNVATSMLETDVGGEMCWRQLWDVGDGFDRFGHQLPLYFNISVGQHPKDVINSEILSPTLKNCHQHLCSHPKLIKCLDLDILLKFWLIDTIFIIRCPIKLRTLDVRPVPQAVRLVRNLKMDFPLEQNCPILFVVWLVINLNSTNSLSVRSSVYPDSSV